MTLCRDLGNLLMTIDEAVVTLFGDNALVTHVVPSPRYDKEDIILDITIEILKNRYDEDEDGYIFRRKMLDELIYNPAMHSSFVLSKVNIVVLER